MAQFDSSFSASYYWNGAWYSGYPLNSYNGSLWRFTYPDLRYYHLTGGSIILPLNSYAGAGTITWTVSTNANLTSSFTGNSMSVGAQSGGTAYSLHYSTADITTLRTNTPCYLYIKSTHSFVSYNYYFIAVFVDKSMYVKAGGAWHMGIPFVKVSGTWRPGEAKVKVSGTWRNGFTGNG